MVQTKKNKKPIVLNEPAFDDDIMPIRGLLSQYAQLPPEKEDHVHKVMAEVSAFLERNLDFSKEDSSANIEPPKPTSSMPKDKDSDGALESLTETDRFSITTLKKLTQGLPAALRDVEEGRPCIIKRRSGRHILMQTLNADISLDGVEIIQMLQGLSEEKAKEIREILRRIISLPVK